MTPKLVTTPIYYVNDRAHIGHAYTSIAADTLVRWHRLRGESVCLLTGTDEHGQKIAKAAVDRAQDPQSFTDEVSQTFRDLTRTLNLGPHDFIRTTEPRHREQVIALWNRLVERGAIYLGTYSGWYAIRDEAFYSESDTHIVDGKRVAKASGAEVEWLSEPSYFFNLSKWRDRLLHHYAEHPEFIQPEGRRNEVIALVKAGLDDLSVSRISVKWGIPVPSDPKHTVYVWLDALTNYISGWPDWQRHNGSAPVTHIIGKDILKFHAVFWPAFLLAAGLPLPRQIVAHGWWTQEGRKISKSLGNTISPLALIEQYGVDPVRYYLLREVPFGEDGDFKQANLIQRADTELANELGNLAHRVLSILQRQHGGVLPDPIPFDAWEEHPLLENAELLPAKIAYVLNNRVAFNEALDEIVGVVRQANQWIVQTAPWAIKDDPVKRGEVLRALYEALRAVAICLQPFIPTSASALLDQLAVPGDARTLAALREPPPKGTILPPPQPVFRKLGVAKAA